MFYAHLADKELLFKTRMNGRAIRVKFDFRKMIYKGRPEM
jgi:hypothetical protein